jgi:asparagine synthase (glutamine-hydrolysing)
MCGLAGFWPSSLREVEGPDVVIQGMTRVIDSRGPDSQGSWRDPDSGLVLGHRRLAILDVSEAGTQPMASSSGRFVIAYNGEIYNHLEVRRELEGSAPVLWRGHSDTETLLAAIEAWGLEATLKRCAGMFAMALWDRQQRSLHLARDRMGEKPLYYALHGTGTRKALLFGSQVKALLGFPGFRPEIDRQVLAMYMRAMVVPGDTSIYEGVRKVPPGVALTFREAGASVTSFCYWSAREIAERQKANPFRGSPAEAVDQLELKLGNAVAGQLISDVPLGAFLSGGLDSSLVVALMQQRSAAPVRTFTIGFEAGEYDESRQARAVAAHLGTRHEERMISAREALETVPSLAGIYDEPFADSSQIPTLLVCAMAKRGVTVALSGDGGDELFAGYNRHKVALSAWPRVQRLPVGLRRTLALTIGALPPGAMSRLASWGRMHRRWSNPADKLRKMALLAGSADLQSLYEGLTSAWSSNAPVVLGETARNQGWVLPDGNFSDTERLMLADLTQYLPDDILTKVDRAAMSVSLETRIPFLDHRVVEFAWSLPLEYKLRQVGQVLQGKWPVRELLSRFVPASLIDRPKKGFGVPIGEWLRGPLRDWASDLLSPSRLKVDGYLDSGLVERCWREHLTGKRDWHERLWAVLMFQSWLENRTR